MNIFCPECGARSTLTPERWRCDCGGAWEPQERTDFQAQLIDAQDPSLWRYRRLYGLEFETPSVRLGAGGTPLLPVELAGREIMLKLEYLAPTASFKDRGTAVMINILARQGVTHIADDSSGNAGASVAAYAARAGMKAEVFVPAYASPAKQAQIAVYGAQPKLRWRLPGAAPYSLPTPTTPAFSWGSSHWPLSCGSNWAAGRPTGTSCPWGRGCTCWACGWDSAACGLPDSSTVCPAWQPSRPRRSLPCAPHSKLARAAQRQLAHLGFYVEPTSATAIAALPALLGKTSEADTIVVPLTGSGLKGSPALN